MAAGLRFDHYGWSGGREAMLRLGPDTGPVMVAAAPLFEEANRTRAFLLAILRALADRGIGGVLPDLPGQGESLVPTRAATLHGWRAAFAAAAAAAGPDRPVHLLAMRGGALLTHDARACGRWLFAPADGASIVRDLLRAAVVSEGSRPRDSTAIDAPGPPRLLAGNEIDRGTLRDLGDAVPDTSTPSRLLRVASDPAPADRHVAGAPLWRRAEPANDLALATLLAEDLAAWIARCAG